MAAAPEVRLSREMRLIDITMIGVGAMIGAGIFVLTGIAAGVAGPGLLIAFLLNGVVTLFAAAAYAELGSSFHDAGGGYLWVKTGLPEPNGFMSGWMSWFAHAVACSLYALGFGAYFELVLHAVGVTNFNLPLMALDKWLAVAVVALFSWINYRGASETGKAGNIVTVGKILIIGVFVAFGVWITLQRPDWKSAFEPMLPNGMGGVFTAMGLTFIAFEGYEIIAQCSEEVRDPKRNVPRAIFLSLVIVIPIYLLVAFAALGAVVPEGMTSWQFLGQHKETALVDAAAGFFQGGGGMILVGGLLSTMSALNATIYSSSRVSFAMGRDRNLPAWFGTVHGARKTPHKAILASAVLIAFMAVALPIEAVASAADIMFLLLFVQVLWVLISLRKKRPDLDRGFRVPFVPVAPILGILLQLFLAVYLFIYSPRAWLSAALWIGIGLVVFYLYARKRDHAYARVVAVREAAARGEYRILACIANPAHARHIFETASALARGFAGEIVALNVVEVPEGEILARGLDDVTLAQRMLEAAIEEFPDDVEIQPVVKVARRTSFAITETALEEDCNLIIVGRARQASLIERIAATIVDRVVRSSPAQVMVVSAGKWADEVRTILLPFEPGTHTDFAADMAVRMAATFGARVHAVRVVPTDTPALEMATMEHEMMLALADRGAESDVEVMRAGDVALALVRQSREADLVIMGGSEAGLLEQLFAYPLPLELAERAAVPVIMAFDVKAEAKVVAA
jgi:amino acid transporter/nucleotide-binding universal stress UspA family protein